MLRALRLAAAPLALGFAAAALGSRALFAGALGLIVVLLGCALAIGIAARRVQVERTIDRHEVLEGQPVTVRFDVRGIGWLPVQIEVQGEHGRWVPIVPGAATLEWTLDRPGGHIVEASPMRIRDALGLLSRPSAAGRPEALLVLPLPALPSGGQRRGGAVRVGDPEPDGLRAYVPGTPMSRVHWAAAARGGELQERAFVTGRDRLPLVVVDTSEAERGPHTDWAARVAAGHVLMLSRHGGCRVLLPGDGAPVTISEGQHDWAAIHRRLAVIDAGGPRLPASRGDERDAILVSAARAPEDALVPRGPLPPGVVPLVDWPGAA